MNLMLFMLTSLLICCMFYLVSLLSIKKSNEKEKSYSFECGFEPFLNAHSSFSIQFFKIVLIFLLFDVEIVLIFPLPLFQTMNEVYLMVSIIILMVIIIGLYFEWYEGSLKWLK